MSFPFGVPISVDFNLYENTKSGFVEIDELLSLGEIQLVGCTVSIKFHISFCLCTPVSLGKLQFRHILWHDVPNHYFDANLSICCASEDCGG